MTRFTDEQLQELAELFGCSDADVYSIFAGYDIYTQCGELENN